MSIYTFDDYKKYLDQVLSTEGEGRGRRSKLALALGCQTGFISQVISGAAHFSLEHGIKINQFLGHTKDEEHFFMLLLQKGKAGNRELVAYFESQILGLRNKKHEIQNRIGVSATLDEKDYHIYYGQWYFAAIHILSSIPAFQTKESMAVKLNLSLNLVASVLEFLVSKGLVVSEGNLYKIGKVRIHLDKKSPLIGKHHTNWRMEAIKSFEREGGEIDLHYSSILSLSPNDAKKIREFILELLERSEPILRDSPEENLYALCIDLFEY